MGRPPSGPKDYAKMVKRGMNAGAIVRALGHRNYRLYFLGQGVSLIGTWMQQVAMTWLVYRLSGSAFLLGLVGFSGQIPAFFLAPVAGVYIDRWSRHRTLLVTQSLMLLQALAMTLLVWAGVITIWQIMLLAGLLGVVNAFDMPARQAFLVDMVAKEDLGNAIALNSSMFNGARLVGPSVAGLLIAVVGETVCFLLNALSYLAVLAALAAMDIAPHPQAEPQETPPTGMFAELREGVAYALGFPPIRVLLVMLASISLAGVPLAVLMPIFATQTLGGDASTMGFLTAAIGLGAVSGALVLASRESVLGLGRQIAVASAMLGGGMIGFAFSHVLWLSLAFLLVAGFAMVSQMAACNTILQTIVDEDKRGRVMSLYTMAFLGTAPIGSLLAGSLASRIGAPATVHLGGLACLLAALYFAFRLPALRTLVRPIYRRVGILPEVAAGLQSVSEWPVPPED